jgi:hypothetical protein
MDAQAKFTVLESKNQFLSTELETFRQALEEKDSILRSTLKKLDRLKFQNNDTAISTPEPVPVAPVQVIKEEGVDEWRQMAEYRLKEIHQLRDEQHRLLSEFDHYRLRTAGNAISDDKIREHPYVKDLLDEMSYQKAKHEEYRNYAADLSEELEKLSAARRLSEQDFQEEEKARRKLLETELKRMESDLIRIRSHRDQLQRNLDQIQAKNNTSGKDSDILIGQYKERIRVLESEVARLTADLAGVLKDSVAVEYAIEEHMAGRAIDQLTLLKEKKILEEKLFIYQNRSEAQLVDEVSQLRSKVRELEKAYSSSTPLDQSTKSQLEVAEKMKAMLMNEIQAMGASIQETEQRMETLNQLVKTKDDEIYKITSEVRVFSVNVA